jgi:hypothetical protein
LGIQKGVISVDETESADADLTVHEEESKTPEEFLEHEAGF